MLKYSLTSHELLKKSLYTAYCWKMFFRQIVFVQWQLNISTLTVSFSGYDGKMYKRWFSMCLYTVFLPLRGLIPYIDCPIYLITLNIQCVKIH